MTSWVPIGKDCDFLYCAQTFKGVFDGQGHTISGLYCNVTRNSDCTVTGLFGYVRGTVKNLNVSNAYVSSTHGGAGGIVGSIKYSTAVVRNCVSAGKVIAPNSNCDVGGIVGCAMPPGVIENCGSTAELDGSRYGYGNVGGICGFLGASGGMCTMENCWFARTIGANCGWAAGAGVIQDTFKGYVSIRSCYTAYQSANYIFQTDTALQSSDQGAGGCGKFGTYDVQGCSTLTVAATENSGGNGY